MEKRILRAAGVQSLTFLGICIFIALMVQNKLGSTVQADVSDNGVEDTLETVLSNCSNYIKIKKSQEILGTMKWSVNYLEKCVEVTYIAKEPFSLSVQEEGNGILKNEYTSYSQTLHMFQGVTQLTFHNIFEVKVMQDAAYIYVALYKPEDLYESIIVIDPGHGGIDSGTAAIDPVHYEKYLNLTVAKKLKTKLEQSASVKVYMTREEDIYLSPNQRIDFINELKPDLCISIHCNSAENLEATGVEVFYKQEDSEAGQMSKKLAKVCLDSIVAKTNQVERGIIDGNSIYIIRNSQVPIVLVEIGFLSNQIELNYILQNENQENIADGIVNAVEKLKG